MLIAVSKIILAAERTFPVFVKAMVNGLSVDGAAADGDVFRRNTGQLLCMQVVIDIVCAPLSVSRKESTVLFRIWIPISGALPSAFFPMPGT